MTSSFLKSRLNKIIVFSLVFIILLIAFQVLLTKNLIKYKPKIVNYLSEASGYRLSIENISFNFLKGLCLNRVSLFYNNQDKAPIILEEANISFRILPLFLGKIAVGKIKINELKLVVRAEREGLNIQIIYSDIYKRVSANLPSLLNISTNTVSVYIDMINIIYVDNPYLEKNMLILLKHSRIEYKSGKFKFDSNIQLRYHLLPEKIFISRFLKEGVIEQDIKCMIQGNMQTNDLNMDMILLNIGKQELIGMGINKNFAERNPYLDIDFIPSTVSLNNIKSLKDNFNSEGNAFVSLKIYGPMDNVKTFISALIQNCNFRYHISSAEVFDIKSLEGELEYRDGILKIDNAYFELNDLPLNIKLQMYTASDSDISLNVSLPQKFLFSHVPSINRLEAEFKGKIKKTWVGNLEMKALYTRKELNIDMRANFKNVEFDYFNPKAKYLRADSLELIKDNTYKIQKLNFTDLKSNIYVSKNRFEIKDINFSGYGGRLNGELSINIVDKPVLSFMLKGEPLDVKELMQDMNFTNKLLSGTMAVNVNFDNRSKEFLKGDCYIEDGITDLDALAVFVKLPSLKNTHFDIIHAYFGISKDAIRLRGVKLQSPDIMLNGYCDTNDIINGTLNIKIASELLRESIQFRKLLDLSEMKTEYVDFKFLLGGIPKAVRFMWMKGEFKEKIKQRLPSGIKKSIQDNLDKTIEELSNN